MRGWKDLDHRFGLFWGWSMACVRRMLTAVDEMQDRPVTTGHVGGDCAYKHVSGNCPWTELAAQNASPLPRHTADASRSYEPPYGRVRIGRNVKQWIVQFRGFPSAHFMTTCHVHLKPSLCFGCRATWPHIWKSRRTHQVVRTRGL